MKGQIRIKTIIVTTLIVTITTLISIAYAANENAKRDANRVTTTLVVNERGYIINLRVSGSGYLISAAGTPTITNYTSSGAAQKYHNLPAGTTQYLIKTRSLADSVLLSWGSGYIVSGSGYLTVPVASLGHYVDSVHIDSATPLYFRATSGATIEIQTWND